MSRRSVRKVRHRRPSYEYASLTIDGVPFKGVTYTEIRDEAHNTGELRRRIADRLLVSSGERARDDVYGCPDLTPRPPRPEGWDR